MVSEVIFLISAESAVLGVIAFFFGNMPTVGFFGIFAVITFIIGKAISDCEGFLGCRGSGGSKI